MHGIVFLYADDPMSHVLEDKSEINLEVFSCNFFYRKNLRVFLFLHLRSVSFPIMAYFDRFSKDGVERNIYFYLYFLSRFDNEYGTFEYVFLVAFYFLVVNFRKKAAVLESRRSLEYLI